MIMACGDPDFSASLLIEGVDAGFSGEVLNSEPTVATAALRRNFSRKNGLQHRHTE